MQSHTSWYSNVPASNLVFWWAKKRNLVARSSAEAEYRSLANAVSEILWLQSLLTELHCRFKTPRIHCDNLRAVPLSHNPVITNHSHTKHMELDIFFVWEKIINKSLEICHVSTQDQWADILPRPCLQPDLLLFKINSGCLRRLLSVTHPEFKRGILEDVFILYHCTTVTQFWVVLLMCVGLCLGLVWAMCVSSPFTATKVGFCSF